MYDGFIEVYSKTTGAKQWVPKHWLDHEVLGRDFSKTPSARSREAEETAEPTPESGMTATSAAEQPNTSWTRERLDLHAAGLGIDTTSLANKGEVLAAIEAATTSGDTPSSDQTPAAGENQE